MDLIVSAGFTGVAKTHLKIVHLRIEDAKSNPNILKSLSLSLPLSRASVIICLLSFPYVIIIILRCSAESNATTDMTLPARTNSSTTSPERCRPDPQKTATYPSRHAEQGILQQQTAGQCQYLRNVFAATNNQTQTRGEHYPQWKQVKIRREHGEV